jgi:hypothetical protein
MNGIARSRNGGRVRRGRLAKRERQDTQPRRSDLFGLMSEAFHGRDAVDLIGG